MRCTLKVPLAALLVLSAASASNAQDRGSASFVTGVSIARGSAFENVLSSVSDAGLGTRINWAGRVAFEIAPGFQAIGEVGRLGNTLPPLVTSVLSFSPLSVRAPAFYEEGGVRLYAGSRAAVRPYVEATGGLAQMRLEIGGVGATTSDLIDLGLSAVNRTSPLAGLGGGVMLNSGPLTVDLGYRYKKIFARDFVTTLLNGGGDVTNHQLVAGIGVRF